jgi:undecaprenyl phosphate-alpha-L-ara4N flippase subunit ArnE
MSISGNNVLLLITVFISTLGQVFLKLGVQRAGGLGTSGLVQEITKIITSPYLILGFSAYALSAYLTLVALTRVDLSIFSLFTSLSYVLVLIISYIVFSEPFTILKVVGCGFIITGVFLVSK